VILLPLLLFLFLSPFPVRVVAGHAHRDIVQEHCGFGAAADAYFHGGRDYGFANFEASTGPFTFTSLMTALKRPSSHRNEYLNGNFRPFTS
jgi:hypothetical protein